MTHSRSYLTSSSTTRASFLALVRFSSSGVGASGAVKATDLPSGAHLKLVTPVLTSVSRSASPPRARISQTLFLPERDDVKAIHLPSGDHCGLSHDWSPCVSWKASPPSAAARWTCVRNSLLSS